MGDTKCDFIKKNGKENHQLKHFTNNYYCCIHGEAVKQSNSPCTHTQKHNLFF